MLDFYYISEYLQLVLHFHVKNDEVFFALKKQKVEQITPNTATINRANVVLSPVSASLIESFIPRKLTMLSEGGSVLCALVPVEKRSVVLGALVPVEKRTRLSYSF